MKDSEEAMAAGCEGDVEGISGDRLGEVCFASESGWERWALCVDVDGSGE